MLQLIIIKSYAKKMGYKQRREVRIRRESINIIRTQANYAEYYLEIREITPSDIKNQLKTER